MRDLTHLLGRWTETRDTEARDELVAHIYPQLHRLAAELLRADQGKKTLATTELFLAMYHELIDPARVCRHGREHFFALAGRLLRWVLLEQLRWRGRSRRPARTAEVVLEIPGLELDVLALDQALELLQAFDPQAAQIVELHYFAGLSHDETALVLRLGRATVARQWRFARAWLRLQLDPLKKAS